MGVGSGCWVKSWALGWPVAGAASKGAPDRMSAARSLETALMWAHEAACGQSRDPEVWQDACRSRLQHGSAFQPCIYISSPLSPQEYGCLDRDRIKSSITEQEFGQ